MKAIIRTIFGYIIAFFSSVAFGDEAIPPAAAASAASWTQTLVDMRGNGEVARVIQSLTEDIPMTTAPAAYVLGVAGDQVPRYTTFREFSTGIERGIGKDGKIVNAIAAEIAPLLALKIFTLEDQGDWRIRALSRTTLSVVTTTASDDQPAKSAFGIHSVLYSRELDGAIDKAASAECKTAGRDYLATISSVGSSVGTDVPKTPPLSPERLASIKSCQKKIDEILNRWNQTMVAVGLGQAYKSDTAKVSGLKKASKVGWLTASYGFGSGTARDANQRVGGLLTVHARWERDGIASTPQAASPQMNEDADLVGVSLRGGKAHFNGVIEYSRRLSRVAGLEDEHRYRTVLGLEYRVQKDLYLNFGIGSETGRRDGNNNGMALANLKWGFGGSSLLAP